MAELDDLLAELDSELPVNPNKKQPTSDVTVDDFGRTSDIPMEGFSYNVVKDTGDKLGQWWSGAKAGYNEAITAGKRTNEVLLDPTATPEQMEHAVQYNKNAAATFIDETLKPVSYAAGIVSPVLALPALAGDTATIAKDEVGKGNTYAPNIAGALGAKFSGAETIKGAVENPRAFGAKLYNEPITTAAELLPAALTGTLGYRGAKRLIKGEKAEVMPKAEPTPELQVLADELPVREARPAATAGSDVIAIGEEQLGKPYVLGGDGTQATDCGLFTQQVFAEKGIDLGTRLADGQYLNLEKQSKIFTDETQLQPGDMVFWDVPSNRSRWEPSSDPAAVLSDNAAYKGITHVGIYAGEGKVLQAGSKGVGYMDLDAYPVVGYGRAVEGAKPVRAARPREEEPSAVRDVERVADEEINKDIAQAPSDQTGFIEAFSSAKNAVSDSFVDSMWERVQNNENIPRMGALESRLRDMQKAGEIKSREDITMAVEQFYSKEETTGKVTYDASIQGSLGNKETIPTPTTYDKPVTRQEIINEINDLVISRTGKIGNSKFEGIYKVNKDVIRSREYGDFDTYAHEIGHYIDKKFAVKGHEAELIGAADALWGKNKTYEQYTPEQRRAEGIAEFGRQYLLNPAEAQKTFPGYYKDFIGKLSENRDILRKLNNISGKMRAWFSQSAEARGRGSVSFAKDEFKSFKDKAKAKWMKVYENWFDDKVALSSFTKDVQQELGKKLEFAEDPYRRARAAQGSPILRAEMLIGNESVTLSERRADTKRVIDTLNKIYDNKLKHEVTLQDVFDVINPKELNAKNPSYLREGGFKDWKEALSTLLIAKRQLELQKINPEYKGPMLKTDAEAIVKNAPTELHNATEKFYQYHDNLLSIAEAGGIVSKETHDVLREKYKNYAPMMRDFTDEGAITDMFSMGKKIGNVSNPLKKLTEEGSARSVVDPLENTLINTYTLLGAVERNRVAQTFLELDKSTTGLGRFVEEVPGTTGDAKKSIFTVMVNGDKKAFQTTPEYYRAIMSLDERLANDTSTIIKMFAQALRLGATISPDFVVRNVIRDTVTAGIYSETGFKPVLDTIKGMKSLVSDKELAYEYKASGAPMATFVGFDRADMGKALDKMSGDSTWRKVMPDKIIMAGYETMRKFSEAAESSTRIREFERARQQGRGIEEAGFLAKEVTLDFSRAGAKGRMINQKIPFFNAVLQGSDRFVRAMRENPKRTLAFTAMYITVPSIYLWAVNHSEEWYKEMPEDVKNKNWLIKSGGTILKIPKPFEVGAFFGSGIERALDYYEKSDNKMVKQYAKYVLDSLTPGFIAAAITPIIEWQANYNLYTNQPIVGRREQQLPDEYQFNAYTSELAKKLGKATGLSPMKIDNTIAGYTASAGKFLVSSFDPIIGEPKEMPEKKVSELPAIRGLTYTPFKHPKSVEEFYDRIEEMEKSYSVKGKAGNPPKELKIMRGYAEQIRDLNKANRELTVNTKLSPSEKRSKIDANSQKILNIARKAIK